MIERRTRDRPKLRSVTRSHALTLHGVPQELSQPNLSFSLSTYFLPATHASSSFLPLQSPARRRGRRPLHGRRFPHAHAASTPYLQSSRARIVGGEALPRRPPWLPAATPGSSRVYKCCNRHLEKLQQPLKKASTIDIESFNGTAQQGKAATVVGFCYYRQSFLLHPSGRATTSRGRQ